MKIPFTKAQYQRLLELVYVGNWIINAHDVPSDIVGEYKKYEDILWFVWSFAKDFGVKELVDQEWDKAYPSWFLEGKMLEYISEYEDTYFRDELADRMATKELLEIYWADKVTNMSREEYFIEHDRLVDKWSDEFLENDLKNMKI